MNVAAGYLLYFKRKASVLNIMVAGGDKSGRKRNVVRAKRILKELDES